MVEFIFLKVILIQLLSFKFVSYDPFFADSSLSALRLTLSPGAVSALQGSGSAHSSAFFKHMMDITGIKICWACCLSTMKETLEAFKLREYHRDQPQGHYPDWAIWSSEGFKKETVDDRNAVHNSRCSPNNGCLVQVGNGIELEAFGLQFKPYLWCPCGVTWDLSQTVVVIKLLQTSALMTGDSLQKICLSSQQSIFCHLLNLQFHQHLYKVPLTPAHLHVSVSSTWAFVALVFGAWAFSVPFVCLTWALLLKFLELELSQSWFFLVTWTFTAQVFGACAFPVLVCSFDLSFCCSSFWSSSFPVVVLDLHFCFWR